MLGIDALLKQLGGLRAGANAKEGKREKNKESPENCPDRRRLSNHCLQNDKSSFPPQRSDSRARLRRVPVISGL